MLIFLVVVFIIILLYFNFNKSKNFFEKLNANCEKGWPLFGIMWPSITRKQHFYEIINNLYQKHNNKRYVGFMKFTNSQVLIRDLDLIKQIGIKNFEQFHDHLSFNASEQDPLLGKTLLRLSGEKWKQMRATVSPAFTSTKLKNMFNLINESAFNFTNYFVDKKQRVINVEFKDIFTRYTTDIIATTAYGIEVNSLKDPENSFYLSGQRLILFDVFVIFRVILLRFPLIANLFNVRLFPNDLMNFFRKIVNENIRKRKEQNIIRPDLIHLLLQAQTNNLEHEAVDSGTGFASIEESDIGRNHKKMKLTDDHIVAQALMFFFASFETASTAACFMAYELVKNPEIQAKLQEEIDHVKQTKKIVDYQTLLNMKYLDQVICESLRLWPPTFLTDRLCANDFQISPLSEDEKPGVIEKGVVGIVPILAIHRDSKYFPNPEKFDPERFSDENKEKIVSGSYLPFGLGPRSCIASRFAILIIKALFFNLLSEFDIIQSDKSEVPLRLSRKTVGLHPINGFNFAFKRRH